MSCSAAVPRGRTSICGAERVSLRTGASFTVLLTLEKRNRGLDEALGEAVDDGVALGSAHSPASTRPDTPHRKRNTSRTSIHHARRSLCGRIDGRVPRTGSGHHHDHRQGERDQGRKIYHAPPCRRSSTLHPCSVFVLCLCLPVPERHKRASYGQALPPIGASPTCR
jgi:hypothetical protein